MGYSLKDSHLYLTVQENSFLHRVPSSHSFQLGDHSYRITDSLVVIQLEDSYQTTKGMVALTTLTLQEWIYYHYNLQ